MEALGYLISLAGIGLMLAGVALQVLTFRKRRPVRPLVILLGQASSIAAMAVYSTITLRPPGPFEWLVLLGIGFGLGLLYGRLVKVESSPAGVVMSFTIPWLIAWGSIMALTQFTSIVFGRVPVLLYCLGILNAGMNAGMNAKVVSAAKSLRALPTAAMLLAAALTIGAFAGAASRADAYEVPSALGPVVVDAGGTILDSDLNESDTPVNVLTYGDHVSVSYGTRWGSGTEELGWTKVDVTWYRDLDRARDQYRYATSKAGGTSIGSVGGGANYGEDLRDPVMIGLAGTTVVVVKGHAFTEVDEPFGAGQFSAIMSGAGSVDWQSVLGGDTGSAPPADTPPADTPPADTPPADDGGTQPPDDGSARPPGGETGDGTTDGSTSGGTSFLEDFYSNQPLPIGQQAAANGLAGGVLTIGSLLQMLTSLRTRGISPGGPGGGTPVPGSPGAPGASGAPADDPLSGAPRSADGRVYFRAPWDEAGAGWMTEAEARDVAEKERQGLTYSKRWGWVSGGQESEYEAARARASAAARERDPEIVEIERRIREARAAAAAAKAAQERIAKTGAIWERMAQAEKEGREAAAEIAHWERVAGAANFVKGTADFAVNVMGTYGGPLGRGIRIGYNYTSGLAGGYGQYLAEGVSDSRRLAVNLMLGHAKGLTSAIATEAIDAGVTKIAAAVPKALNYLRGVPAPPPVPPSLLTTQAALRQLTDPSRTVTASNVLKFVEEGGLQRVAQLERLGHAPAAQVQRLVTVVTREVDGAVTDGAKQAFGAWNRAAGRETGVRVTQVLVGDAGSSAGRALRSAATDADRTVWAVFDKKELAAFASRNGMTEAEAAVALNRTFASTADDSVQSAMRLRGIDPAKVDYKTYAGFGGKAGPSDAYPTGDALVRTVTGGRTTVVSATRDGGLTSYRTGGSTIVDEYLTATGNAVAAPRIATQELAPLAQRQLESIAAHADAKSVAKAVTRLAYVDGRAEVRVLGESSIDPAIKAVSQRIRANPQEVATILNGAGLTEETFRTRALATAQDVAERVGVLK